jgi:hypothetical protein
LGRIRIVWTLPVNVHRLFLAMFPFSNQFQSTHSTPSPERNRWFLTRVLSYSRLHLLTFKLKWLHSILFSRYKYVLVKKLSQATLFVTLFWHQSYIIITPFPTGCVKMNFYMLLSSVANGLFYSSSTNRYKTYEHWFLAWLVLQPWRWKQHVPLKCQLTFYGLHGTVSQKIEFFITTGMRTCNPTYKVSVTFYTNNQSMYILYIVQSIISWTGRIVTLLCTTADTWSHETVPCPFFSSPSKKQLRACGVFRNKVNVVKQRWKSRMSQFAQ